jgi:hypothetical protein
MAGAVPPFLRFEGAAEEATKFYVALVRNSEIRQVERYAPGESRVEGSIKRAGTCRLSDVGDGRRAAPRGGSSYAWRRRAGHATRRTGHSCSSSAGR